MVGNALKGIFKLPRLRSLTEGLCDIGYLEYEQALIRLLFITILVVYLMLSEWFFPQAANYGVAKLLALSYGAIALLNLLSFYVIKRGSRARRVATLLGDHAMTCLAMYHLGEMGVPLSIVLFWITVGYGARFGAKYLYLGMMLSTLGLLTLIYSSGFWIAHPINGYSLIITNIVIPLFVSKILRQLVEARAVAEEASQAKSRFLANISHEMRTPLSCIIGLGQLLLTESNQNPLREKIQSIDLSARHLLNLIDDILDFSRIEAGQIRINAQSFDLHQLLNDTYAAFVPIAQKKQIDLTMNISPDVPVDLMGDPLRIQQILNNLIGNAIKFTHQGQVAVHVNCPRITPFDVTLRVEISDTGIGIPEEKLGAIFQRFNQVDESITREYGGSGLGVTISNELVNRMGGMIHVESRLGEGSRFYFDLPMKRMDSDTKQQSDHDVPGFEPCPLSGKSEHGDEVAQLSVSRPKVLIAEDNTINRMLLGEMLRKAGVDIVMTEDGASALQELERSSFDLAIVDMQMPRVGGLDVITQHRSHDGSHREMPFIVLTANATEEAKLQCREAGADLYFQKPMDVHALIANIRQLTGQSF